MFLPVLRRLLSLTSFVVALFALLAGRSFATAQKTAAAGEKSAKAAPAHRPEAASEEEDEDDLTDDDMDLDDEDGDEDMRAPQSVSDHGKGAMPDKAKDQHKK